MSAGEDALAGMAREVGRLSGLARAELRGEWRHIMKSEPPNVSRDLLLRALAYAVQAQRLGGLLKEAERALAGVGDRKPVSVAPTPGTRFVREWRGEAHVVEVAADGALLWRDHRWSSLSAVAGAITGTRWSGPAFFGLRRAA